MRKQTRYPRHRKNQRFVAEKRDGIEKTVDLNTPYKVLKETAVLEVIHAGAEATNPPEYDQNNGRKAQQPGQNIICAFVFFHQDFEQRNQQQKP
ncbi:hypothetical protein WDV93_22395 [Pantoea ananatis]